jgi:hypothetical protein
MLENRTQRARSPGDVGRCRRQAPGYGKTKRPRPRTEWAARKHLPFANRGTAVIRAHRAGCGKSRVRNGHGCQRPSCGHGSGPTGKCIPEMPDCDQPRRASRSLCFVSPWVGLDAAFSSGGCVHFHLPVYTCRSNRVCAHTETRPALTQVVSKRRKLHCRFLDNASRD